MTSTVCSSVRAACSPFARGFRPTDVVFWIPAVTRPRVTGVRTLTGTPAHTAVVQLQQVGAASLPSPVPLPGNSEAGPSPYRVGRRMTSQTAASPAPHLSARVKAPRPAVAHVSFTPEMSSGLEHRAEVGVSAPRRLECAQTRVSQLCHLGEVVYALEGRRSAALSQVLDSLSVSVGEGAVSPREAVRVYSLLAACDPPTIQQHTRLLSTLHTHTQRLVRGLSASQVSGVLGALLKLQQRQAVSLLLQLNSRAARVFAAFRDEEVTKVLSALVALGQRDEELLAAMEKHLPGRLGRCDPQLVSAVMEYCLHMRCRSEPLFEAVARNFVQHSDNHTTDQIAKQLVAMARLNYLPQCSTQMFKKLESILSSRLSQFQPRSLLEVLHACIHLERFPLNYVSKVFSPFFLQRLRAQGAPLDKTALGQLTQLHLSTSLETSYRGPRLPTALHVKSFWSMDEAFETPVDQLLYQRVRRPLTKLLGGKFYSPRTFTPSGYTIDVEICLDENGFVLPPSQWEHTHRRTALSLDGPNRFCSNTHHLLGKEATKRRHLRGMGYDVVQIPHYEFETLRTREEQVRYLHDKIFSSTFRFRH